MVAGTGRALASREELGLLSQFDAGRPAFYGRTGCGICRTAGQLKKGEKQ